MLGETKDEPPKGGKPFVFGQPSKPLILGKKETTPKTSGINNDQDDFFSQLGGPTTKSGELKSNPFGAPKVSATKPKIMSFQDDNPFV